MASSAHESSKNSPAAIRHALLAALLIFGLGPACAHKTDTATDTGGDFAEALQLWEWHMVEYGHEVGEYLVTHPDPDLRFHARYYDGQWVFLRIAQYTGDKQPWARYARIAGQAYKHYLEKSDFQAAGWQTFPHGLYVDWKLHGDAESREYLFKLATEPPYADPFRDIADGWYEQLRSREVAYSIETQILAQKAGAPRKPQRLRRFIDMALTHVESWTTGDYVTSNPRYQFCKPFMAGLTASALISYYEYSVELGDPDERIPAAVQRLADWLWAEMWVANADGNGYGAFEYVQPSVEEVGSNAPAGDLNMLIAPMYGWLYYRTGNEIYRRRGDAVFIGGVALAWLGQGKQFNQQYRSSFDYLMWRAAGKDDTKLARRIGPAAAWAPGKPAPKPTP